MLDNKTSNHVIMKLSRSLSRRRDEKRTLGCVSIHELKEILSNKTFISPQVSNLFQFFQLQIMSVCFIKDHLLFLV